MQVSRLCQQPCDRGLAGARRSPEHERAERARRQHARERAIRSEQMILPNDIVEFLRPELVGKRPRRILVEPRRGKKAGAAGFRPHSHRTVTPSPAEYGGNSLPVTNDHDAPGPVLRLAQAIEVLGPCDALAIDLLDDVAALEAQIAGIGTVI